MPDPIRVPGKLILLGEHAVVYGVPALAVPVTDVYATAAFTPANQPFTLALPDLNETHPLAALPADHPAAAAIHTTLTHLGQPAPTGTLTVSATIPLGGGLGSSAAFSVAIIRALSAHFATPLADATVSALAYETEKLHHGAPSGIDNTVIAYARPVYFIRGLPIEILSVGAPFTLVIADTGIAASTKVAVSGVRQRYDAHPDYFDTLFARIAELAAEARALIENGYPLMLGPLLDENHSLLQEIGVSSHELDTLVAAARNAGSLGAKLSGGGLGGNMLALTTPTDAERIAAALTAAGAVRTIITTVQSA